MIELKEHTGVSTRNAGKDLSEMLSCMRANTDEGAKAVARAKAETIGHYQSLYDWAAKWGAKFYSYADGWFYSPCDRTPVRTYNGRKLAGFRSRNNNFRGLDEYPDLSSLTNVYAKALTADIDPKQGDLVLIETVNFVGFFRIREVLKTSWKSDEIWVFDTDRYWVTMKEMKKSMESGKCPKSTGWNTPNL